MIVIKADLDDSAPAAGAFYVQDIRHPNRMPAHRMILEAAGFLAK